jgi:hypothetical protein
MERTRQIAIASGLLAAAVALFWIVQAVRGAAHFGFDLAANIVFFGIAATFFGMFAGGRRDIEASVSWPIVGYSVFFVYDPQDRHTFGIAGAGTFVIALGLVSIATALDWKSRGAAAALSLDKRRELEKSVRRSRVVAPSLIGVALVTTVTWFAVQPARGSILSTILGLVLLFTSLVGGLDVLNGLYFGRVLGRLNTRGAAQPGIEHDGPSVAD